MFATDIRDSDVVGHVYHPTLDSDPEVAVALLQRLSSLDGTSFVERI
jgi:hypothetical protein